MPANALNPDGTYGTRLPCHVQKFVEDTLWEFCSMRAQYFGVVTRGRETNSKPNDISKLLCYNVFFLDYYYIKNWCVSSSKRNFLHWIKWRTKFEQIPFTAVELEAVANGIMILLMLLPQNNVPSLVWINVRLFMHWQNKYFLLLCMLTFLVCKNLYQSE